MCLSAILMSDPAGYPASLCSAYRPVYGTGTYGDFADLSNFPVRSGMEVSLWEWLSTGSFEVDFSSP